MRIDLVHALRAARKQPLSTATIIATLALTIGANTAIVSVVDHVLVRSLPYPEPDRLVLVATFFDGEGRSLGNDGRTWETLRDRLQLVDVAALSSWTSGVNFAHGTEARLVQAQRVSAEFFDVLGVRPAVGRAFTDLEDTPGGPGAVVLGHDLWRRVFFEDPGVVGTSVLVRGEPHTVVGVMPAGFRSGVPAEAWTPLRPSTTGEGSGTNYEILGRLKNGATLSNARAEVETVGRDLFESDLPWRLGLVGLRDGLSEPVRRPLVLLWSAAFAVLVIGCVNVASMLSARGVSRANEIRTRLALGARPSVILRQLLTESALFALTGGVAGLLVGKLALETAKTLVADSFPFLLDVSLDARAAVATGLLSLLACAVFGVVPAVQGMNVPLASSHRIAGGRSARTLAGLTMAELALTVPLVVAAALLARSFAHLQTLEPGIDASHVVAAKVSLQDARYADAESVQRLVRQGIANVSQLPEVEAAGVALSLPYERWLNMPFRLLDRDEGMLTTLEYVTPEVFDALGVPLLRGRAFADTDDAASEPVAIVSRSFAERYLSGREPLSEHVRMFDTTWRIVGVVGDVQQQPSWDTDAPLAALPTAYIPLSQTGDELLTLVHTWFSPSFIVKTKASPVTVSNDIQRALGELDPLLPPASMSTLDTLKAQSLGLERLLTTLFGSFGILATLLAAVGIYGVVANNVAARERELSIRVALGATRIRSLIEAARPAIAAAALGLAAGLALSLVSSRLIEAFLWGVGSTDPASLASVAAGMALLAVLASVVPASRVTRASLTEKLRGE